MKDQFLKDVIKGLSATDKYLLPKYFYNKRGDEIFSEIMDCDDYYLTRAETEIFKNQSNKIVELLQGDTKINVVELGPGDMTKSVFLINELEKRNLLSQFYPVDISVNIITKLQSWLPEIFPGISVNGICADYMQSLSGKDFPLNIPKLVLFLGANIGNYNRCEVNVVLRKICSLLNYGDMVLIGFDLKKHPEKILKAYNDSEGLTKEFNLNLLSRINFELGGNFELKNFEHYASYNPQSGECKSYLIATKDHSITIAGKRFYFKKYEPIFMEVSNKYSLEEIHEFEKIHGFKKLNYFSDSANLFTDVLWQFIPPHQ